MLKNSRSPNRRCKHSIKKSSNCTKNHVLESSYIDAQDKLNAVQDERIRNP